MLVRLEVEDMVFVSGLGLRLSGVCACVMGVSGKAGKGPTGYSEPLYYVWADKSLLWGWTEIQDSGQTF